MAKQGNKKTKKVAKAISSTPFVPPHAEVTEGERLAAAQAAIDPKLAAAQAPVGFGGQDLVGVQDVRVRLSAVLGAAEIRIASLLKLGRGAVIELDRRVGESIDIYVCDRLVARGEVVVIEDRLGVTLTEIVKSSA